MSGRQNARKAGLVLTLKDGEEVLIGDEIRIEIVRQEAGRSILRIVAPKQVRVDRAEVRRRIEREGRERREAS